MIEITSIFATTGIVKEGNVRVKMTREALESIRDQIAGEQAVPSIVNHDPFCMPIAKVKEAWVEPLGDEYAALARIQFEDVARVESHRSGARLAHLSFEDNPKPFKRLEPEAGTLVADWANFDSIDDYRGFEEDVSGIDDTMSCGTMARHSLTPEPLLQFAVANPEIAAALTWMSLRFEAFLRYTVDQTLRKLADEISDSLSAKMKNVLSAYSKRRAKDNRPSVTQIIIPGNTELVLLVKTELHEEFPALDLKKLTAEMEKYRDLLQDADSARFARVGADDWEFLYLTTRSGQVIGTLECYERAFELLRSMRRGQESEAKDASKEN